MTPRMSGRVALVTGAARGIGEAVAHRLAGEGAAVAVADRDAEGAHRVASDLQAGGGPALGLACDVTDASQVEDAVRQVLQRFGRLDVLVNNAGIVRDDLLFRMSEEDWDAVITVHLKGTFLCTRAAQRPMVEQRYGRIICLSSISALGNRGQVNYAAAKAGIQGFVRTAALELGRFGITVNAVAPGFIDSDMTRATARRLGLTPEEFHRRVAERTALGRIGTPDDVAGVVAFLASDDAAYVSGQTIYAAGGPVG